MAEGAGVEPALTVLETAVPPCTPTSIQFWSTVLVLPQCFPVIGRASYYLTNSGHMVEPEGTAPSLPTCHAGVILIYEGPVSNWPICIRYIQGGHPQSRWRDGYIPARLKNSFPNKKSGGFLPRSYSNLRLGEVYRLTYRYPWLESQRMPARHSCLQVIGYSMCDGYNIVSCVSQLLS